MSAEYYTCWYRLDGHDRYLIWYTNDVDGVCLRNGKIPVFTEPSALMKYAASNGIKMQAEEPGLHDLDVVVRWLQNPTGKTVECPSFNAAWNLFADVSRSAKCDFDQDQTRTKKVYEKLFCGLNLPSVTPEGKEYEPIWTKKEVALLHEVLAHGLQMFRSKIDQV